MAWHISTAIVQTQPRLGVIFENSFRNEGQRRWKCMNIHFIYFTVKAGNLQRTVGLKLYKYYSEISMADVPDD